MDSMFWNRRRIPGAAYAARKAIVEPVFGQIKQARGIPAVSVAPEPIKVRGEWTLVCLAHNV